MPPSRRVLLVLLGLGMNISQVNPSFVPVLDAENKQVMCALDLPSEVIPVADVSAGIPMDVPGDVICGFACVGYRGCISFNHRQPQQMSPQCEIFTDVPRNCISSMKSDEQCSHYEASGSSSSCRPPVKQLRPSLTNVLLGSGGGLAVTSLNDRLFVARTPDQIKVYSATTLKLLGNITVIGASGNFWGLAACPVNNFLYISEWTNFVVHRVNLSSAIFDRPMITNWTVCNSPVGLFVNSRHNLIVTCASGVIREYTANGLLIRQLSDRSTWHTVEVNNETYAISRYNSQNQVCHKVVNGTVLRCYGNGTAGSGLGQLNWPQALAVDKQGFIVVADEYNNRILVLNPTLTDGRLLPLPNNITGTIAQPLGLWLDESRGRLYVAEFGGKRRVLVFDNVYNLNEAFTP